MAETTPSAPIPFPARPGIRPPEPAVEPPPLQPSPAPMPEPTAPPQPQPDPGNDDQPQPELPAAARAATPDPLGFIRFATIHAEQAEHARVMCIEYAAGFVDQLANGVAFRAEPLLTRVQVVGMLRLLAGHVRALKDPNLMERA